MARSSSTARKHRSKDGPPATTRVSPEPRSRRRLVQFVAAYLVLCALVVAIILIQPWFELPGDSGVDRVSAGLPATADYHSLLVSPTNPDDVYLGTHDGLFRSTDAGATWRKAALDGRDAMSLARVSATEWWAAGHDLLMRSSDGGATWQGVSPQGLPGLDVHGFAVDPSKPGRLWAAVAGQGLFRSDDDGATFRQASRDVGGAVMALAVLPDGRLLAGDMQQGLVTTADGGRTWRAGLREGLMGLAVSPADSGALLATGAAIFRSTDGGAAFARVLETPNGSGPVAFAPSLPTRAYVVGLDGVLYRSDDTGATWRPATR